MIDPDEIERRMRAAGAYIQPGTRGAQPNGQAGPEQARSFDLEEVPDINLATIPPRQWLYSTKLIRGFVTILVAPGGSGKSLWAIGVALGLARGKAIFDGDYVHHRSKVAILSLEDPMDELHRRIGAMRHHHKIKHADITGHLFAYANSGGQHFTIAMQGEAYGSVIFPDEAVLLAKLKALDIGLLIVDPYAESHLLEENSNPHMVAAAGAWRRIARAAGCAVLLVHHVRKGSADGIEAARGAKATTDSARVGLLMSTMDKIEGAKFAVHENEWKDYSRIETVKANMSRRNGDHQWLRFASIDAPNGTPEYPNGDNVGVIESWKPPGVFSGINLAAFDAIMAALKTGLDDGQRYTTSKQSKARWAGTMIVEVSARKLSEDQASVILAGWQTSGLIKMVPCGLDKHRNQVQGIEVNEALAASMRDSFGYEFDGPNDA